MLPPKKGRHLTFLGQAWSYPFSLHDGQSLTIIIFGHVVTLQMETILKFHACPCLPFLVSTLL